MKDWEDKNLIQLWFKYFIIIASILLYFARHNYRDFNINKAISACVLAKKQNTTNFDKDLVQKQCEEDIRKSLN